MSRVELKMYNILQVSVTWTLQS